MSVEKAEEIRKLMTEAREQTLGLFDLAEESELHESPGFGFRPIIWHLAHIGAFEGYWLLQRLAGQQPLDEHYERIFDPIKTPRESSRNLPTRREMESYLERVRSAALRVLDNARFEDEDPLLRNAYIFHLVLQHEYQHQETLAYLFHLLEPQKKRRPQANGALERTIESEQAAGEMIRIPAGSFQMGTVWDEFAYDNELPVREVYVPAFKIGKRPVTNAEYARFVEAGGYERREFWSDEGWSHKERENWTAPLYWTREGKGWRERGMFEEREFHPHHPVTNVSWYEAEAYARFAGKRLPTEAEWEKAASWDDEKKRRLRFAFGDRVPSDKEVSNFGFRFWETTPVGSFPEGASPYGCLDMTGNVWEWTGDKFEGYEGFRAFPYPEYSEEWFDGDHRVLRGGSWATRAPLLRTSFRNFFRRHFRIGFTGIRLAD
ncbi:MAG: ergothioneine biosynthesis protein EgtB [Pyrinomonadaceae bacterium]|nr:ergothioneine biosynthesis protein EgtB [Pyrinomonadaceae bacterium]